MGKRKDKKSLKIWDLVIKSLIAIAALITSIAELIKALTSEKGRETSQSLTSILAHWERK